MKKIYFVRHGQSTANVDGIRRGAETELTQVGKQQAKLVAKRFKHIDVDVVLSSPYKRAYHTGKQISEITGADILVIEQLRERMQPDFVIGKYNKSKEVLEVMEQLRQSWLGNAQLPDGAESFNQIIARVDTLMNIVSERDEENIVLASHAGFGRQLMLRVLLQDAVTPEMILNIHNYLSSSNVGITTYTISDEGVWKLEQWNDDAHLGEIDTLDDVTVKPVKSIMEFAGKFNPEKNGVKTINPLKAREYIEQNYEK